MFSYFIYVTILNFRSESNLSHKLELSLSTRDSWRNKINKYKHWHQGDKYSIKNVNLTFHDNALSAYQVCATVKRRCFGILLLKSILRKSLGEFRGEITGDNRGEADEDFPDVLDFSCCNRFSLRVFTRSSLNHGFWQCVLSTSGRNKVSGLVSWAMLLKKVCY